MRNQKPTSECIFDWLEKLLHERKNSESALQKIIRKLRTVLTFATVVYFLGLIALMFLLSWWGERNWILSILLFVPAVIWLLPLFLLAPCQIFIRPKLCWISLAAVIVLGFVYLDFNWAFFGNENKRGLTLLTNNVGGRKFHTLAKVLEKENPDLIALQDTARISGLARQYPERFVANVGQFILVSKIPIRQSGALSELTFRGRPIGVWHELQYGDQTIVIYNLHMPTPRGEFSRLRGRGFVAEIFGGKGVYSSEVRNEYQEFLKQRLELLRGLTEILQKEKRPYLVAGDFNMPSNGYFYDRFSANLRDAFREKGRGYGFTFPGTSTGWLNVFGPWLRIDYLFSGKDWRVNRCELESSGVSEHRAVIAQFELKAANKP